jgi:alpha-ketoglutarate-dependent 2,4-dichlorophenoxyacetate dioxygenase
MAPTTRQVHPLFFGEVSGIDIRKKLTPEEARYVIDAMDRYGVCLYRDTGLSDEQHVAFSRYFGKLEMAPVLLDRDTDARRLSLPELFDAGNINSAGGVLEENDRRRSYNKGNQLWHTDSSFNQHRSSYSLLLAHAIPPRDADTEFADMRAAYDALPPAMKEKIENLVCVHDLWHSRKLAGFGELSEAERAKKPPAQHKLVQTHAGSGRKHLFIAKHASHIVGWPVEEGFKLITELIDFATQPRFVHAHKWRVGDLVIWDNRCTMHRATPFQDRQYIRDMRRTTVYENVAQAS